MYKVFVTRKIPEPALELLRKETEVTVNPEDRVLTKEEVIEGVRGKDALLCLLIDKIDGEVMDAAKLKVVSNCAVGYDNIDVEAATKRGIPVTNTPGVLTETVADLTWALLMSVARRIVESDRFVRSGKWTSWAPMLMLGTDVHGKTLGIVGLGRIGSAVARRAKGFNMKILYHSRTRKPDLEKELSAEYVDFETLLRKSDFVSIHLPLADSTYHMIGERELNLMKKTAYLVNTSRGPIVDEEALTKALKERKIAGAALDVFEHEPKVNSLLLKLDNVVLAPHIGSASLETRTKMAIMAAENLLTVLKGRVPPNLVNKEVLKLTTLK